MKMKHNFAKGGSAKVKSVGMRISIIISILLIITLGAKTAFDTVRSYNLAISTNKDHKYEETRKLAKQLEQKFISAYYSARTTEGAVSTMMKNIPTDQRQRVFISNLVESMLEGNKDIGGCGVFFEPNAFDGKDAHNITHENKEGLFQSYYLREANGNVTEIRCTYDPETKSGSGKEVRKVKGTIHWVSAAHAVPCEVRLYENIVDEEKGVYNEDGELNLNPNSLTVIKNAFVEESLKGTTEVEQYQFVRNGFFCLDSKDSKPEMPVFNRIVSLKSSYNPNKA